MIDGGCENVPFDDGAQYAAPYAKHSKRPNARLEEWPSPSGSPFDLEHRLWLVASESIEPGAEIRVDYGAP